MNKTKNAVIITIFASMCQGKNHYTKTSVDKIQENLEKYHKIHVKRRWIFYCLANILDAGLITRKARYRNNESGLIRQHTSLLSMTLQGLKYLVAKKVHGAWKALKTMIAWLKRKDGRWPDKDQIGVPDNIDQFKPGKGELENLLGIVGKKI